MLCFLEAILSLECSTVIVSMILYVVSEVFLQILYIYIIHPIFLIVASIINYYDGRLLDKNRLLFTCACNKIS